MNHPEEIAKLVKIQKATIHRSLLCHEPNPAYAPGKSAQYKFDAIKFLAIERPLHLAYLFNSSISELESFMNFPCYKQYFIDKKKGGKREIWAPDEGLKKIQHQINHYLQSYYLWIKPDEAHGFVANTMTLEGSCNIVENARPHVNRKYVLNIDLQDFFPSVSAKRVRQMFSSSIFNFNEQISTALTLLTTIKGRLPIGSPCSPVISNFICLQMDGQFKEFSERNQVNYTRYADDLTFSSNQPFSPALLEEIKQIILQNNFVINTKKFRLKTSNRKQVVTGLTVNEKVNIDRHLLKKVRAMLHDAQSNGIKEAAKKHFNLLQDPAEKEISIFRNRLAGYINFIGQVKGKEDVCYKRFSSSFNALFRS